MHNSDTNRRVKLDRQEFGEFWHCIAGNFVCGVQIQIVELDAYKGADSNYCNVLRTLTEFHVSPDSTQNNPQVLNKPELRRLIAGAYCPDLLRERWTAVRDNIDSDRRFSDQYNVLASGFRFDDRPIGLLWIRNSRQDGKTLTPPAATSLYALLRRLDCQVILAGDTISNWDPPGTYTDLTLEHLDAHFGCRLSHARQLYVFEKALHQHRCCSLGLQSGGMDGLAYFLDVPTVFLSDYNTANNGMKALADSRWPFVWPDIGLTYPIRDFSHTQLHHIERCVGDELFRERSGDMA